MIIRNNLEMNFEVYGRPMVLSPDKAGRLANLKKLFHNQFLYNFILVLHCDFTINRFA